jgi:hypothetical protein
MRIASTQKTTTNTMVTTALLLVPGLGGAGATGTVIVAPRACPVAAI